MQDQSAGMTFDAAPVQQATPVPMTFDATPTSQAITVPTTSSASTTQPTEQRQQNAAPVAPSTNGTIAAVQPPKSVSERIGRWADNVSHDLKYGTDLTGVGSVLQKLGAHGVYNGNSEAVGDFMASLPLGLLRATKGSAELDQPGKRWQGVKDTASGVLQASTIPASFVSPEAAEGGTNALDAGASQASQAASRAAKAVRGKVSPQSIQPELQQGLRNVLNTVAKDEGVTPNPSTSIRDAASQLAAAVRAKASGLYQQLDQATGGGRFQRFDDQIQNIQSAIRDVTGIDPDREGQLIERLNTVQDAKDAALVDAKAKGVDPKLIDQANAAWKRAAALDDLSRHIRMSASGMRPGLAEAGAKTNPEILSTAKLFPRINGLYNSGRLQQALGPEKAADMLQAVDAAHLRVLKAKAAQNLIKSAVKVGASGAGMAGAYEVGKHLVGTE
jgi:hypothetical protein